MVVVQTAGAAQQGAGLLSSGDGGVAQLGEQSCYNTCASDDLKEGESGGQHVHPVRSLCLTKSDSDVAPIRNSVQPGGGD